MKLLLTGEPKSGKTTLLEGFINTVPESQGFVTREIREGGERVGFELVSSIGQTATLASVKSESDIRVSRYGVNVDQLDEFLGGLPPINMGSLLYVDEIGQMELYSDPFKKLVTSYLDSDNTYAGTITSVYHDDFTDSVLGRNDIVLLRVQPDNRTQVKGVLDGLSGNLSILPKLSARQQEVVTHLARDYARSSNFVQLKKLFKNAIKYIAEGRVSQQSPNEYVVNGNTRDHVVKASGEYFACDCDLFNGKGDFKGQAGECSHIQAAKLIAA